jgi:hypothetical protein
MASLLLSCSALDTVLAAIAEANECVLVTDNEKQFSGLSVLSPLRPGSGKGYTDGTTVPSCRRWVAKIHSGGERIHANAHIDADARDPDLVPGFKSVSAQDFVVYRVDPHVVVFCPSALGGCVVGSSSQGVGADLYPRAPRVRLVVLDTPGDGHRGVEWIWRFS